MDITNTTTKNKNSNGEPVKRLSTKLILAGGYGYTNPFPTPPKHAKIPFVNKVITFVKEAVEELKKTRWPTKKETIRLTGYLMAISFGVGVFVSVVDFTFKELLTLLINR